MALEQGTIVDAFKQEGLDETIAEGLNFDTDEQMNKWIGNYKKVTSFNPSSLDNFTPEQLLEMARNRQSRSMQSLVDKLKDDAKKKVEEEWAKTHQGGNDKVETGGGEEKSALEKKIDELEKMQKEMIAEKQARESELSIAEKKKSILDSLKKEGCDNEEVLEFVELKMKIDESSDVESLKAKGKSIYDEKYKKLFNGKAYSPASGGGSTVIKSKPTKEAEAIIAAMKEKNKNKLV